MNLYQYLRDICGFKYISSQGSITSDLLRYYKYSNIDLNLSFENYISIYTEFWQTIQKQDSANNDVSTKIKLVSPLEGKYTNVVKIDFKRAFTNYSLKYLSLSEIKIYNYFCNKISRAYLIPETKKFLYNYCLTNIVTHYSGKEKLNQLRYSVYQDVLYLASRYGEVIKSEVDGCYVVTEDPSFYNFEVFGEYSVVHFDDIYYIDRLQISKIKDKIVVKGLDKMSPNIYTLLIVGFLRHKSDRYLYNYFYNPITLPISDWCKKSELGNNGRICLKNMIVDIDVSDSLKVYNADAYREHLSRNAYFDKVKNVLMKIMLFK